MADDEGGDLVAVPAYRGVKCHHQIAVFLLRSEGRVGPVALAFCLNGNDVDISLDVHLVDHLEYHFFITNCKLDNFSLPFHVSQFACV